MESRFIVDVNAGKLAKWLRIMGYDTLFFNNIDNIDDARLIRIALEEERILLTKDTQIPMRRVATEERLKAILIKADDLKGQLAQVVGALNLDCQLVQFSLCIECNQPLVPRRRGKVKELVPPYVFKTQTQYMQCPSCHKIYWRGTHWQRMKRELEELTGREE